MTGGWRSKRGGKVIKKRRAEDEMKKNMRKNDLGERAEGEIVGEIEVERNNDMMEKIEGVQSNVEKSEGRRLR